MPAAKALEAYRRKRDFSKTIEPSGDNAPRRKATPKTLRFVVQKHAARRLHYDFRLELDGVLKSWAVAKGPSLVPGDKRLAVHVEDHPLEYGDFEGVIPQGQYGAGAVIVWDRGHWIAEGDPRKGYAKGHLKFSLRGDKLGGDWNLVRMHPKAGKRGDNWLLIKAAGDAARASSERDILDEMPDSVLGGKPIERIADDPAARKWTRGQRAKPSGASSGALTPRQRAGEQHASRVGDALGMERGLSQPPAGVQRARPRRPQRPGRGDDDAHRPVVCLDPHGGQQLLVVDQCDHWHRRVQPGQRPVVGAATPAEPTPMKGSRMTPFPNGSAARTIWRMKACGFSDG